jgi:hypothetical protein
VDTVKMSGGGVAGNSSLNEQLLRQMVGGNTAGMIGENPWLQTQGQTYGRDGAILPDPIFNIWIPVPMGPGSPWKTRGSRTLGDCSVAEDMKHLTYMLQFMLMATELGGSPSTAQCGVSDPNGTPSFNVSPQHSPKQYEKLMQTYVLYRDMIGGMRAKPDDIKYLKAHMSTVSPFFDAAMPEQIKKVAADMEAYRLKKKETGGGAGGGAGGGLTDLPVRVVQFPEVPADPRDIPAWREQANALLKENRNDFAYSALPLNARQLLESPDAALRREEVAEEERRAADKRQRIHMWVKHHLPPVMACRNRCINVDPLDVIFTTKKSLGTLVLKGCRTWPVSRNYEHLPTSGREDNGVVASTGKMVPKVLVTWFVLDDKKNSLFRFSVYDPNFSLYQTYRALAKGGSQQSSRPRGKFGGGAEKDPFDHLRQFGKNHVANIFNDTIFEEMYNFFRPTNPLPNVYAAFDNAKDAAHLSNVLTLKRAIEILNCVDADTTAFYRSDAGVKGKLVFPEGVPAYVLHPRMCFWYSQQYLGIGYITWPTAKRQEDFAQALIMGDVKIQNGQLIESSVLPAATADDTSIPTTLSEYMASHKRRFVSPLVDKRDLLTSRPKLLNYETGDQIVLWQAEGEEAMQYIRQLLPEDPESNPEQYAVYCTAMERFRAGQLGKFGSIWTLDSTVDTKPISQAHKAVIRHLGDVARKSEKGTVTMHMPYFDEGMTVFGNMCIQRMMLFSKSNRIINTKIPFMAAALLSTFDKKRDGEPKVHLSLSGPPAAGKTFPLHFFIKKCFIRGTFEVISSQSDKANNIDGHLGSSIALMDEPPKWYHDADAEDKNYDKVQETKNVFTQHQHNRSVLSVTEHEGNSFRLQKNIYTDDPRTWAFCTNKPRDKKHALGTRIFQVTLPKPILPPEAFDYEVKASMTGDTRAFFKLDQALCVEVYTAMTLGLIPDIDMWLFRIISQSVFHVLREWKVIDGDRGDRSRQIMAAFIRHLIIVHGVTACRHVPGGALYNVPYCPEDVVKIGPYLVCTLEMVLTTLHFMASELIDEDMLNAMVALCKLCKYNPSVSAYENYNQSRGEIPFKQTRNPKSKHGDDNDGSLWDLNMLYIEGTPETIAGRVAPLTEPQLDVTQVQSIIFKDMVGKSFPPMSGKRYRTDELITSAFLYDGIINQQPYYDPVAQQHVPADESFFLSVDCTTQVLAEYEKKGPLSRLYFSPAIMPLLDTGVIERAFYNATITASFPRVKVIKGIMMDQHPDIFKVADWNDAFIGEYIRKLDKTTPNAPVSRRMGVAIATTEQRLTSMEQNMLLSARLNPSRTDHDDTYFGICNDRSASFTVVKDWELEQAKRVAFAQGTPLDSIVFYTDAEIRRRYDAYVEKHPDCAAVTTKDMDYPHSIIEERLRDADTRTAISHQMTKVKKIRISSDYIRPRAQPQHHRVSERSVQHRRSAPVEVPVAAPATASGGGSGSGRSALERMGVRVRK